jgi:hypothetical protein
MSHNSPLIPPYPLHLPELHHILDPYQTWQHPKVDILQRLGVAVHLVVYLPDFMFCDP